ncbi:hypothetical protein DS2_13889 [Catenovulum agarivorans DS-2]|uniref:Solute-binding protein family 3/N-terminal domain-containing protein n=1 Tax=Catenovulum agarivorans DS-2 TaxID=1328313 RepID=W7Q8N0_9ALTE|nr:hypothetical protein [Catenovulum agarivorans]EWH09169.1 hypothetical protein DS2_13889 [Catenovulum agarivorans DS-2]
MRNTVLSIILLWYCSAQSFAQNVVYAAAEQDSYYTDLLALALSYSIDKNYTVSRYNKDIPKPRLFEQMAQGRGVDVVNGSATHARLDKYQAIHFPILRGLKSWRIALIHKSTPDLFANIHTLEQFKALDPVQFNTWVSTRIFRENGIKVVTTANFKGLFQMLNSQRSDYFPRSILDIRRELKQFSHLNIMIDPYLLIQYPSAFYFYVKKDNNELASDINNGLEKALVDGRFGKLFYQAFGQELRALKLQDRRVIRLDNHSLPSSVPLNRPELWVDHSYTVSL